MENSNNDIKKILTPKELKDRNEAQKQEAIKLAKKYSFVFTMLQARVIFNILISLQYKIGDALIVNEIIKELQRIVAVDTNIPQVPDESPVITGKES